MLQIRSFGPQDHAVRLTITTWNINSVRFRIAQVRRFLAAAKPDVLCLQETKCPNDCFPLKKLRSYGYPHIIQVALPVCRNRRNELLRPRRRPPRRGAARG